MGRTEEHKEEWKKGERGIEGRERGGKIGERREKGGREDEKNKGRW